MGQGLNVKIRQLVADEFGLSPDKVIVMATSTEKNINTSADRRLRRHRFERRSRGKCLPGNQDAARRLSPPEL